jgi:hypothetical protein
MIVATIAWAAQVETPIAGMMPLRYVLPVTTCALSAGPPPISQELDAGTHPQQ